jgi:hypothetical protein
VRRSESWSLVPTEDPGPKEDLCDGLELYPPWTQDFLDPIPGGGGEAQVLQQSSKPAGGDRSFDHEGLHLVRITVHHLDLDVTRGRALFVDLLFYVMVLLLLLLLRR